MKTKSLLVFAALLLLACQPKKIKETEKEISIDMMDLSEACAPAPILETVKFAPPEIKDDAIESDVLQARTNPLVKTKKIIKDGSMSIKVKDVEVAKKHLDKIVKTYDAYYENESFENYDRRVSYNLKVRIPAKQFDSFLKDSEKSEGEIIHKNISARDVTEEYIDGEIRLNSKRLFRNRYNQLLEKAGKVEDILAIEENIRTLQEEIESQEGQLKFLDDQVTYSTLEITLFYEKRVSEPIKEEDSFITRVKASLGNGWNMLVTAFLWCMVQWPWYLLVILISLGIKMYLKKRRKQAHKKAR